MAYSITQAVILSAGLGKRLRPITDNIPKVMVPILGTPLLEHHIRHLKLHGINEIFINLHYCPEAIQSYFGTGERFGIKIQYAFEKVILGTAGGIKNFERKLKDNFFVIYGDIFSLVDYTSQKAAFFKKIKAVGMELIGDTDHPHDSDLVEVDENLRFLKIYPKPHTALPRKYKSMRSIFIFNKKILKYIPKNVYYEIDHQLLPHILNQGEYFYGYECGEYLRDIGTIERLKAVEVYLNKIKNQRPSAGQLQ